MQYRKVEDRTERSVLVRKIRNIPFYDSHSISVLDKLVTGSLDHLRIEVDRRNTSGTEILDLSGNTFARSKPMSRTSSPSVRPPSAMSFGITLLLSRLVRRPLLM